MAGNEGGEGAGPPPAVRSGWWTTQWRRWCVSRQLDVAYGATVVAVVSYLFGLLLVVIFVLRHTEPAMTTVDILFLAVSTITQAGMLPLMFINVSTWGHVVLFAALALKSFSGGPDAGNDPWDGQTLEWWTSSPPPPENFDRPLPPIRSERPVWDYNHPDAVARH